jgi:LPXTG-motif cell wall-anchored protein
VAVGAASTGAAALPAPGDVTVVPADVSGLNATDGTTGWDAPSAAAAFDPGLPAGSRWTLDIEDKVPGQWEVTDDGLELDVAAGATVAESTKVRFQYFVGTGGYPAIDAGSPTLADVLAGDVSWTQTLLSGDPTYGPTLQIKLEDPTTFQRVTVFSNWDPGTGARDLAHGLWLANTAIDRGDGTSNPAGSGPGVDSATPLNDVGDFRVVSFGPNLGRDLAYDYRIQELSILGATFHFAAAPTTPPVDEPPTTTVTPLDPASYPSSAELPPGATSTSGTQLTVDLGAEHADEWVYLVLHSTPVVIGWVKTDASGHVSFSIPASLGPGGHTVAVYDADGGIVAWAAFAVDALAETGTESAPLVGAGIALLLLGGVALALVRRRRRHTA